MNLPIPASMPILLALLLPGCQTPVGQGGERAAVQFVDAAGNRMTIDVPPGGEQTAQPTPPSRSEGAMPPTHPADPAALEFAGEQFTDVDAFERSADARTRERFYTIPRADGGVGVVTASSLGMGDGDEPSGPAPPRITPAVLRACPGGVSLAWLLPRERVRQREELAFPVRAESYDDPRRYAGYRLPLPVGTTRLRVWAIGQRGTPPDVVVALLDGAGNVMSVVNNIATESIPETPFTYARVGGEIVIPPVLGRDAGVVIVEGAWARKSLPAVCRPGEPSGAAVAGHVTLEYLQAN